MYTLYQYTERNIIWNLHGIYMIYTLYHTNVRYSSISDMHAGQIELQVA